MFRLFKSKARRAAARAVYDQAVMAARAPWFYRDLGVPDTVMGRFDMIVLHVVMAIHNCPSAQAEGLVPPGAPGPSPRAAGTSAQDVFDEMFVDIERSLREMGVGDLSVPKKMRAMMRGFNGRAHTYVAAFAAVRAGDDAPLRDALQRNVYATVDNVPPTQMDAMVGYVKQCLRGEENEKAA
jgi:cytochrome b pre-mRNA-processing protein 3